jgi:hypothetical protein
MENELSAGTLWLRQRILLNLPGNIAIGIAITPLLFFDVLILIDLLRKPRTRIAKWEWVLAIVVFPLFGGILYLILSYRKSIDQLRFEAQEEQALIDSRR